MIKKFIISIILIVFALFLYEGKNKTLISSTAGAPAKNSGSPGDGQNCATSCHGGPAKTVNGWITTNIPSAGYSPDSTYTITAKVLCVGKTVFGFQVSPQDAIGNLKGTLFVTNATTTQTMNSPGMTDHKYMTHRAAGTTGTSGSHNWTFNWKAPVSALATTVTFYGAFLANTGNGIDSVFLCSKTYNKFTGIENYSNSDFGLSLFPNPVSDKLTISFDHSVSEMVDISIYNMNGKQIAQLENAKCPSGNFIRTYNLTSKLSKGTYFVRIMIGNKSSSKKIVVI